MKDIKDCVENGNSKILQILQDLHESAKSHRILDNIDINCIDNADICDIEEFYSCLIAGSSARNKDRIGTRDGIHRRKIIKGGKEWQPVAL